MNFPFGPTRSLRQHIESLKQEIESLKQENDALKAAIAPLALLGVSLEDTGNIISQLAAALRAERRRGQATHHASAQSDSAMLARR